MKNYTRKEDMSKRLTGVFVPTITPFINDEIQYKSLKKNLERLNSTNIHGHLALGSNGENKSLSQTEKLRILEIFVENKGNKLIMAGTGCESTKETINLSREAEKIGVDFVSVLTPSYFPKYINDSLLIDYYTEIAEYVNIPLLVYNAPGFSGGVKISPEAIRKLAMHPNIAGMKDSSEAGIMSFISSTSDIDNFNILVGSISTFLPGLVIGASGGVLSCANYFPEICCDLFKLFSIGKIDEARKLYLKLFRINTRISGKYGVSGIKAAASLAGYFGGEPRRPLKPLSKEIINELRELLLEECLL